MVADAASGWVAAAPPREEGGGQGEAHRAAHVARLVSSPRRWVSLVELQTNLREAFTFKIYLHTMLNRRLNMVIGREIGMQTQRP